MFSTLVSLVQKLGIAREGGEWRLLYMSSGPLSVGKPIVLPTYEAISLGPESIYDDPTINMGFVSSQVPTLCEQTILNRRSCHKNITDKEVVALGFLELLVRGIPGIRWNIPRPHHM
ncbi:hypothetical protein J6590_088878 [Homalodisca vitripennis]|nr:hypothetical protein J6590_088878 [Homalodisca vitripennis]